MIITNISDAKASLSHLIEVVQETKEPIIIGKSGKPVAVLSAYNNDQSPRELGGSWEGNIIIEDDFDSSDNEWVDDFYNTSIFPEKE